ncbi:unnamed protein product, partial [Mesorhabditis belari]|uniref:Serine/threonine-protein phosphatase n=1 Tax=Mesorhabditis belari TaxID=2138241 RepID=A0AAF3J9U8_9BILA
MSEFYWKFLHKHLAPKYSTGDKRIGYTLSEVAQVLGAAKEALKKDNSLIEMNPPIVIVGDIHGQYYDLLRMFSLFNDKDRNEPVSGTLTQKYLFLGDYVDRGSRSLECIMLVFVLKILFPKKYGLVRGNHECRPINRVYGFFDELQDRFGNEEAEALWQTFNETFALLPLAGLVGKKIFCMHGELVSDRFTSPLAMDLLWADPMIDLIGFMPNQVRGVSVYFGESEVVKLCKSLNIDLIVRAHQMMQNGYGFFCGRKLMTIFTAPRYFPERNNKAAVLVVDENGKCSIKVLLPCDEINTGEKAFRKEFDLSYMDSSSYQFYKTNGKLPKGRRKG